MPRRSNIPTVPACGVYIFQSIQYPRDFVSYYDFLDGVAAIKETTEKWKSSHWWCCGRHRDLVSRYGNIPVVVETIPFFFHREWSITDFLIRWVPPVEQELNTLPDHLSRHPICSHGSCCSLYSFMCSVLWTTICLVPFTVDLFCPFICGFWE